LGVRIPSGSQFILKNNNLFLEIIFCTNPK
jgi:hypothetical protein